MKKRTFFILLALVFCAIIAFHFNLNYNKVSKAPSDKWGKEVSISSGNIQGTPALIKYKNNYIVAHNDGNNIKILSIDKYGKKTAEKTFSAKGTMPTSVNIFSDGKDLYLYWLISDNGKKFAYDMKLDEKFNVLSEDTYEGVYNLTHIESNVMVLGYIDNIKVIDLNTNKSFSVKVEEPSYIAGTKNKDSYIISFNSKDTGFKYFTFKDGVSSEIKDAGNVTETTTVAFSDSALIADNDFGYIFVEYRSKGEPFGAKVIKFPLNKQGKSEIYEYSIDNNKAIISNIVPYITDGSAEFMAKATVAYDKKREYEQVAEFNITNGNKITPVSRTREVSMYPAVYEDMAVFCDISGEKQFNVYVTSKSEEFKKFNSNAGAAETKLALIDTLQAVMYSLVYVITYGMIWIIPTVLMVAIYTFFEYGIKAKNKKIWFIFIYSAFAVLKLLSIRFISYRKYISYMPEFMPAWLGLFLCAAISLLCGIYAYKSYSKNIDNSIGIVSFSLPMLFDSILTLLLMVPFIV